MELAGRRNVARDGTRGNAAIGLVTTTLIAANVLVYLLQTLWGDALVASWALWPIGHFWSPELQVSVGFKAWQLLTSAFLHASFLHIFLNMYALYLFGRDVEGELGAGRFIALYFTAVITAGLVQLLVVSFSVGPPYPTLGASGGVFGVLLAFGKLFPRRIVMPLLPPIPMRAWLFVTLYGFVELVSGVFGTQEGVAHFAHLGGMLGAYLVLLGWKRRDEPWLP
jgi:membrane associated rhomboid family serine protease